MEGFAHAGSSSKIHLESLHRLLPEGIMTAAGQVVRAIFEQVHPGRGYTYKDSPKIKKFPTADLIYDYPTADLIYVGDPFIQTVKRGK